MHCSLYSLHDFSKLLLGSLAPQLLRYDDQVHGLKAGTFSADV